MAGDPHAVSAQRRKQLRDLESQSNKHKTLLDTFPIDKYYGMAERLLFAFDDAFDDRRLDEAYILGMRFANFSIEGLPKHKQYKSVLYKTQRSKNSQSVESVLEKLESVATRMDAEERVKEQKQKEALEQKRVAEKEQRQREVSRYQKSSKVRHAEALQRQREEYEAQLQSQRLNAKKQQDSVSTRKRLERSAQEKLRMLQLQTESKRDAMESSRKDSSERRDITQSAGRSFMLELNPFQKSSKQAAKSAQPVKPIPTPLGGSKGTTNGMAATQQNTIHSTDLPPTNKVDSVPSSQDRKQQEAKPLPLTSLPKEQTNSSTTKQVYASKMISIGKSNRLDTTTPSSNPSKTSDQMIDPSPYKPNLTAAEAKAMRRLEDTIKLQQNHLSALEESNQIVLLGKEARERLANGDKKGALSCLARRRRLNKRIDVVKHSIFNMETQIMMLESAVEDREVTNIMQATSNAMSDIEKRAGLAPGILEAAVNDPLNDAMSCTGSYYSYDEEDLLDELMSEGERKSSSDQGLLALPSIPSNELPDMNLANEDAMADAILAKLTAA